MILSFADDATEDLFNGTGSKKARRRLPEALHRAAARKLDMLNAAEALTDLAPPKATPATRLEALQGDREGQHSVRINDQYRVCFVWTPRGPERVEVVDYH